MFGYGEKEDREPRRPKYNDDERQRDAPLHTEKIVTDRKIFFWI